MDDEDKIDLLSTYMSGKARMCIDGLLGNSSGNFQNLVSEMKKLFSKLNPDNYKNELQKLKRKNGESLQMYALRVTQMVRLVYPSLEADLITKSYFEDQKKDHFIRGLGAELAQSVNIRKPSDLEEAVRYAEILEADLGLKRKENLLSIEENEPESQSTKRIKTEAKSSDGGKAEDGKGFNFHNLIKKLDNHTNKLEQKVDNLKEEIKNIIKAGNNGNTNQISF